MLCCGRQLQLCSVKNKTQLSHTVYHSLQQLFLSGGFFYFKTQPTVNSVTSSLPMCCWVHIALYRRLYRASMESMMGFFLFCLTHHFHWKLPYPIQKQTWQLQRWEDTNWLIFFRCSGLRTMNYIQYVRLLMILFKSVQCFWDWETTAGITLMIHTPECRYEVKPPTSSFILNLICSCVHLKVLTGI